MTFILPLNPAYAGKGTLYTVQIKSLPLAEKEQAYRIYHDLAAKGHLVYYYRKQIDMQLWIRIHVGLFDSVKETRSFADQFAKDEGYDFFITKAVARANNLSNGHRLVTTPSAIWTQHGDSNRELFRFAEKDYYGEDILKGIPANLVLSSQGKHAVFLYNEKLYSLDLETAKTVVLADSTIRLGGLCRSDPRWSPENNWIAFYDCHEWEISTGLWAVKPDGSGRIALSDITETQQAVKSFLWHPNGMGIFFIQGYAFGTISIGGSLYYTDLKGNKTVLDTPGDHQEITDPLSVEGDALHYNLATFDVNYEHHTLTPKVLPLPQSDEKQN